MSGGEAGELDPRTHQLALDVLNLECPRPSFFLSFRMYTQRQVIIEDRANDTNIVT